MIEWGKDGIRYEAEQRHAEIAVRELGLEEEKTKTVTTPGEKKPADEEDDRALVGQAATRYRAIAAR